MWAIPTTIASSIYGEAVRSRQSPVPSTALVNPVGRDYTRSVWTWLGPCLKNPLSTSMSILNTMHLRGLQGHHNRQGSRALRASPGQFRVNRRANPRHARTARGLGLWDLTLFRVMRANWSGQQNSPTFLDRAKSQPDTRASDRGSVV